MIRAVYFDLDNTLFDRAAAYRRYASGLVARRIAAEQRPVVLEKLMQSDDEHQHRDFMEYARYMMQNVPELSLSAEEYCAEYVPGLLDAVEPTPHIREFLLSIARRFKLGLITNGGSERQREKLRRMDIASCFAPEAIVISGEVGAHKPAAAIFQRAIAVSGCAPAEMLFCGDDPVRDIGGATALGIQTCWIFGLRASRAFPKDVPAPHFQLERVEDVEQVLA